MKKKCGTCDWFKPYRNPETGRIRPSMPADCNWAEFKWPEDWPISYTRSGRSMVKLLPSKVWTDLGENCPCWKEKERKPVRSRTVQVQLPGVAATETSA